MQKLLMLVSLLLILFLVGCGADDTSFVANGSLPDDASLVAPESEPLGLQQNLDYRPSQNFVDIAPMPYRSAELADRSKAFNDINMVSREPIPLLVMDDLEDSLALAKTLVNNHPKKSLFSAWDVYPLIASLNDAFLISHKTEFLDDVDLFAHYFHRVRMDQQNRVNFDGRILPQWERLDRYNLLTVSPFYDYSLFNDSSILVEKIGRAYFFQMLIMMD